MKGEAYQRPPHPATWAKMHGRGRVFYTSMGYREDVGANKTFQQIVLGGLSWALGDVDAGITPNFHRVTPEAPAGWSPPKAPNRAAGAGETLPTWHNSLKPASSSQSGTLLQFHSSALRRRADVGSKYRLQGAVAKRLRQRIANPPSPVRIRAAPLTFPLRVTFRRVSWIVAKACHRKNLRIATVAVAVPAASAVPFATTRRVLHRFADVLLPICCHGAVVGSVSGRRHRLGLRVGCSARQVGQGLPGPPSGRATARGNTCQWSRRGCYAGQALGPS